jgi:hypothetical protein
MKKFLFIPLFIFSCNGMNQTNEKISQINGLCAQDSPLAVQLKWYELNSKQEAIDELSRIKSLLDARYARILAFFVEHKTSQDNDVFEALEGTCFEERKRIQRDILSKLNYFAESACSSWALTNRLGISNPPGSTEGKEFVFGSIQMQDFLNQVLELFEKLHTLLIDIRVSWKSFAHPQLEPFLLMVPFLLIEENDEINVQYYAQQLGSYTQVKPFFERMRAYEEKSLRN